MLYTRMCRKNGMFYEVKNQQQKTVIRFRPSLTQRVQHTDRIWFRGLKVWIYEVECLPFLCSKSVQEADLRLCLIAFALTRFSYHRPFILKAQLIIDNKMGEGSQTYSILYNHQGIWMIFYTVLLTFYIQFNSSETIFF